MPRAVWLPECAYRPGFQVGPEAGAAVRPGLEDFLAGVGLRLFFVETHTIEGGQPVGKAREEVIGPYGNIPRRYVVPLAENVAPAAGTTFLPYHVGRPDVSAIGRNNRTGLQVWSADSGYPGDFDYREFHKKDGTSGLQYWRVTGARVDLGQKDYYHPDWAAGKVREHARHFADMVQGMVWDYQAQSNRYGIVAAIYDTELFGHWWFEGVDWLGQVLRNLAQSDVVDLVTASEFVDAHPPEDVVALPESSWGMGGNHFTWDNADTSWMWPVIHEAEVRMERLVARYPDADGPAREVLSQAARELLLLQSSDWPFLVTTGQAGQYAVERFCAHTDRFNSLTERAEAGNLDEAAAHQARDFFERDKLFPDIDYRAFAER
jgi:1,4-alpha-glucan branching enzyme